MNNPANHGGARKCAGRKPKPESDLLRVGSIRLTRAQWARLAVLGGVAWLRQMIDKARAAEGAKNPRL